MRKLVILLTFSVILLSCKKVIPEPPPEEVLQSFVFEDADDFCDDWECEISLSTARVSASRKSSVYFQFQNAAGEIIKPELQVKVWYSDQADQATANSFTSNINSGLTDLFNNPSSSFYNKAPGLQFTAREKNYRRKETLRKLLLHTNKVMIEIFIVPAGKWKYVIFDLNKGKPYNKFLFTGI